MKKIKFNSKLIKTLPNIAGLENLRENLHQAEFKQNENTFTRTAKNLIQTITVKKELNSTKTKQAIKNHKLKGVMIPTAFLNEYLQHHSFGLSQNKLNFLDSIAKMNNGKLNEAEGVNLIYKTNKLETPLKDTTKLKPLAPNFCSQLISTIHYNKKSRLTLGESHLMDPIDKLPYGEALLQISHLTYHALDLDLSVAISEQPILPNQQMLLHEFCFSIPYSLKESAYSKHGYILQLEGQNITPETIHNIIGLQKNPYGAVTITSGEVTGTTLSFSKNKGFLNSKAKFSNKSKTKQLKESIGTLIFDPNFKTTNPPLLISEKIGKITNINGKITMVIFPLLQTVTAEYSD